MAGTSPVTPAMPVVVTFPCEIDMANADQFGGQLDSALGGGAGIVVADMTATTFCDTSGIRILVKAHKQAAAAGAELRVVVPSPVVLRSMAWTKVDTVLRIYPHRDAAVAPNPNPAPMETTTAKRAGVPGRALAWLPRLRRSWRPGHPH